MGHLEAYSFNNILLNSEGISLGNTVQLSSFLVGNGVDYDLIKHPFGWNDATMMVLYNTKKIDSITRVMPKDKISQFDL